MAVITKFFGSQAEKIFLAKSYSQKSLKETISVQVASDEKMPLVHVSKRKIYFYYLKIIYM